MSYRKSSNAPIDHGIATLYSVLKLGRKKRPGEKDRLKQPNRKGEGAMKKKNKEVKKRNWGKWIESDVFSFIRKNKSL
jgi:hypothetical protein